MNWKQAITHPNMSILPLLIKWKYGEFAAKEYDRKYDELFYKFREWDEQEKAYWQALERDVKPRELFDFFDQNNVIIHIKVEYDNGYTYEPIVFVKNRLSSKLASCSSRQEAEGVAFLKAFEVVDNVKMDKDIFDTTKPRNVSIYYTSFTGWAEGELRKVFKGMPHPGPRLRDVANYGKANLVAKGVTKKVMKEIERVLAVHNFELQP